MAVKVGIAGLGFMGVTHYRSYKKIKGAQIIAVFTRDPKKLAGDWRDVRGNLPTETGGKEDLSRVRRYDRLEDLLADPDVDLIDICLPTHLHSETAIKALQAGKNVLVEKPIALSVRDADKMLETAHKVGKHLMVGQVLRFFPEFRVIKDYKDQGIYGRLKGLHIKRIISRPTWAADNWFADPERSGGPIVDLHIHDADFIVFLFGLPRAVTTVGWTDPSRNTPEYFVSQYHYDDGERTVTAQGGDPAMPGLVFEHGYDAYFERATIEFNSQTGQPPTLYTDDGKRKEIKIKGPDAFQAELQYAITCLDKGEEPVLLDAKAARDALLLCLKEKESLQKGKTIRLS
ncbi:MAG: Gfo/Idh/MocA family oxidoreductase [Armatimonadetes bacterium]|nr:Gfo/Idh/MocA family oxidoreductase [Armatimonadota bacterium]MDW8122790.1 Gfo/Idh/MocA family oxidoreductase [Armatimonadota bacterium]